MKRKSDRSRQKAIARAERGVFKHPAEYRQNHRARPKVAKFVTDCMNSRYMGISVDVAGLENIPKTGSAILAPDHRSFYDGFLNGLMMENGVFTETARGDREVFFGAKSEIWTMGPGGIPGRFFGMAVEPLGAVPIKRNGGGTDRFISDFTYLLENPKSEDGVIVIVFPGGTRIESGKDLSRVRSGVTRLSQETGTPVVPIGQVNTEQIWSRMLVPGLTTAVAARVGEPIYPQDFTGDNAIAEQNQFMLGSIRGLSRQAQEAVSLP